MGSFAPPRRHKLESDGRTALVKARAATNEQLVELFAADIWRFASGQLRRQEDAEDVVMEVFSAAITSGKALNAEDQKLWLLRLARNKVADALRKQYRRAETALEHAARTPGTLSIGKNPEVQHALEQLPQDHREALVLKYVNELSTEEIAAATGRSTAAVNSLLQRARQGLRSLIDAQDEAGEIA